MINDLRLRIVPKFDGQQAKAGLADQSKTLREQKKTLTDIDHQQSKVLKDAKRGYKDVKEEAQRAGEGMKRAFEGAHVGLEKVRRGLEGLKEKFNEAFGLKTGITGLVGGFVGFEGIKKALEAGEVLQRARARIGREFGGEGKGIESLALRVGEAAGLRDEDALRAIIPIAEAVQQTQRGTAFRGRRLSAAEAARVREQTLGFGANLLQRITAVTGIDAATAGQLLAEAGTGDQGLRHFAGELGLNRVFARQAAQANEKGRLFDLLGADRAAKFGIHRGQRVGQGTLLDVMLQQSGITEAAAAEERRTFAFQKRAIGAQLNNVLGDIGERTLDRLTKGLGKGATLAEKLQSFLSSEKGKQAIDKIADGIGKIVTGIIKIGQKLPDIFRFIDAHKTLFGVLGTGLLAGKFIGSDTGRGLIGGVGALAKGGKFALDLAGITKPLPVMVVNGLPGIGGAAGGGAAGFLGKASAVAAAGLAGYEFGKFLDDRFDLSGKASDVFRKATGRDAEDSKRGDDAISAHRAKLAHQVAQKRERVKALIAAGLSEGQAVAAAEHQGVGFDVQRGGQNIHVSLNVDGQVLASVVTKHQGRQLRNQTGLGAATTSR